MKFENQYRLDDLWIIKKLNMNTITWRDYQSPKIENWKIFLDWKSNENVENIVYLIWFWMPSNIKPIVLSFYLSFTANLISTQTEEKLVGILGRSHVVLLWRINWSWKQSCLRVARILHLTRPNLTSVYFLITLRSASWRAVPCLLVNFSPL